MEPSTPESLSEQVPYQLVLCVATSPAHWPDCSGIAGRIQMESVAGMEWNQWPESRGMGGRDRLEFAHFTKDTEFASPSAAAAVIYGGNAPGPVAWKNKSGKTLKEIEDSI